MKKQNKIILSIATAIILTNNLYAKDAKQLGTVTVTANKVEENIQNVPQSITVIDEFTLEEKGIKNIEGVIKEIPNMRLRRLSGSYVNFRGLNSSMFTNNNPVVIYIDGVATSSRYGFDASLVNVARIEVLRGPQGTLYGKDAIGAVINIITKEPTNETIGSIGVEYGSDNYQQGTFNINTPVVKDKLYLGINGKINSDDGWQTNSYNGDDKASKYKEYSFGSSFLYKVNDKLSTKLVLKKEQTNDYWSNLQKLVTGSNIDDFNRDDAKNVSYDVPTKETNDMTSQSLSVSYDADNFMFKSITTHKKTDYKGKYDSDYSDAGTYLGLKNSRNFEEDTYSQEFRVSSKNSEGVRWVAGAYFDKEDISQGPFGMEFPNYNPVTYAFIGNYTMDSHSKSKSDTKALFGQAMIPLNEKLELTLGGRFQKVEKEIDLNMYYLPVNTTGDAMYSLKEKKSWNTFLPKVALSYKMNDTYIPYISISKGYMPGGYNYFASSGTASDNSFDPQKSTNYEAGVKAVLEDISFSASIFRMDITDIHIYKELGSGMYVTDNAKKAHSQGVEFDFNYFPSDEWEISGALGFIDAKYDDYDTGTAKFDGKNIEKTPSHTASLSIAYHHPSGYYGRVDVKNTGAVNFYDDANKKFVKEDGHTVTDIKAGYKFSNFDIYAYVKNITNEEYIDTYLSKSSLSLASFNDSRFVGVGVKYKF